ncbi:MAG: sulfatase-like hydrolase/transferase [Halosimplex sp.]
MTIGTAETPDRDVVLVTIDCWRHDALREMPVLRERIDDAGYERAEAVCATPATRGAFAAIFAGRHYPRVYSGFDEIRDEIRPLAAVLSDAGYATGGFVGSNPFLSAWKNDFDGFWNDRLATDEASTMADRAQSALAGVRHTTNYLRFRGSAPATTVADRARDWYEDQSSPRFLWMHLMDPHVPFFPGVRRALRTGPLSVYRSHWRFDRDPESLTDDDWRTLRRCYEESVGFLDDQIERLLDVPDDDALLVVMGDHGEEFDHDAHGHARLYDETVRVPLVTRGLSGVSDGSLVRQIDVGATVLSTLGLDTPTGWTGRPHDGTVRDAFMLNHSPQFERIYAGIRTERWKLALLQSRFVPLTATL